MANSVDPDQMLHSAASDLGLQCLLWPGCPNTEVTFLISVHKGEMSVGSMTLLRCTVRIHFQGRILWPESICIPVQRAFFLIKVAPFENSFIPFEKGFIYL